MSAKLLSLMSYVIVNVHFICGRTAYQEKRCALFCILRAPQGSAAVRVTAAVYRLNFTLPTGRYVSLPE
jgi:hypothetical protein